MKMATSLSEVKLTVWALTLPYVKIILTRKTYLTTVHEDFQYNDILLLQIIKMGCEKNV